MSRWVSLRSTVADLDGLELLELVGEVVIGV
jgi:hypothetical protein